MSYKVTFYSTCTDTECQYCKGTGEIKVVNETTSTVSYYDCYGPNGALPCHPKRTESMVAMPTNTQLPAEALSKACLEEIQKKADKLYPLIGDVKMKIGYKDGATEYATNLLQAQQENESLKRWKQEAIQILNPIWDFADNRINVPLGESKTDAVLNHINGAHALLREVLEMNEMWGDLPGEFINKVKTFLEQNNNVQGHERGCQKYEKGFEDGYSVAIKYDNDIAALHAKGEKLAMWLYRLRGSMMAHPDYVSGNNIEFIDRVDGAGEALAEWKGEKEPEYERTSLTPGQVEEREKAIEWYRNPAAQQGTVWVKASDPNIKDGNYVAKYRPPGINLQYDYVGMAFVKEGYIRFSCPPQNITYRKGHEELQYLQLLDEGAGEKEVDNG
jgi:hypothetical protein